MYSESRERPIQTIMKVSSTSLNNWLDLTWSWVYFSTAAGVPGTGVGSRWLECLTPNYHTSLFSGSMLPRLQIFMSVLTHSDQVFLGLPLLLALGIVIFVMEFMHEEERATCPYHLKRLVRRAAVTSCTPNIAQSESEDTSSSFLTPHIQRTKCPQLNFLIIIFQYSFQILWWIGKLTLNL